MLKLTHIFVLQPNPPFPYASAPLSPGFLLFSTYPVSGTSHNSPLTYAPRFPRCLRLPTPQLYRNLLLPVAFSPLLIPWARITHPFHSFLL
jgi:hypothetical protein